MDKQVKSQMLNRLENDKKKVDENKKYIVTNSFVGYNSKIKPYTFKNYQFAIGTITDTPTLQFAGLSISDIRKRVSAGLLEEFDVGKDYGETQVVTENDLLEWYNKTYNESSDEELDEFLDKNKEKPEPKFNISAETLMVFNDDYLAMAEQFWKLQHYYYDKSGVWWLWSNKSYSWTHVDEYDLFNQMRKNASPLLKITSNKVFGEVTRSMKLIGRERKPKDVPKTWVQFKDKIYDIETQKVFPATEEYFVCNPIPWEIGETSDTPAIDKLFTEWVGEDNKQTLYEIIAYCCLTDYPIHLLFCFIGIGRNGKTKYQQLLTNFIGKDNTCSTELDTLIDSRFESVKLFKKLVCTLGETNFGVISKTSLLKKLSGQDLIGFEFKNKLPFDDYNYAKILINSNSLPSSEDTSEGFYRRWLIVDFVNQFKEGKDILKTIPFTEYNNLAKKVTEILPGLLENGSFTKQGTIEERKERYVMASNPLPYFLNTFCIRGFANWIRQSELYNQYCQYLTENKRRIVSRKEFLSGLAREGLESRKTSKQIFANQYENGYFIEGIKMVENADFSPKNDNYDNCAKIYNQSPYVRYQYQKTAQMAQTAQNTPKDILEYIKQKDIVEIQEIVSNSPKREDWVIDVIEQLKKEGVIYEPKSGFVKAL